MTQRRQDPPEVTREQLFQAAADLILKQGIQAVTLDAIAARAGVLKEDLLQHFQTKPILLDALFEDATQRFAGAVAAEMAKDPDANGRGTRAYLRVTVAAPADDEEVHVMRSLIGLMLFDPEVRELWSSIWDDAREEQLSLQERESPELTLCRLAIDGLWMSDMLEHRAVSSQMRAAVIRRIEEMTRK
ncbi:MULTISPECIES: TetR/AcrR family transcriptional regulator [unclassified Corallococcus]|uniref:TetR/AcrR family transcriptional regulator n=1 Tax=unclassified Corallococcus TaxID=2685029 RepID=UPI001F5CEB4B|nr:MULTISPECIES: TetR/AcrR family transcriptional regulator [unclassified Corallococcus]WAS87836.1 TetR/AcrR family transcriptional regulator [Corallococcus sp. NCRR]